MQVQAGVNGTFALTPTETQLLQLSTAAQQRQQKLKHRLKMLGMAAITFVAIAAMVSTALFFYANKQANIAQHRLVNSLMQQALILRDNNDDLTKAKHLLAQTIPRIQDEPQLNSMFIAYHNLKTGRLLELQPDSVDTMPDIPSEPATIHSKNKQYSLTWGQDVDDPLLCLQNHANSEKIDGICHLRGTEQAFSHSKPVMGADFSPDNSQLISWEWGNTLYLWDRASGNQIRQFAHGTEVIAAKFSEDGRQIISWENNGLLRIWDNPADIIISMTRESFPAQHTQTSSDSKSVIVIGDRVVYVNDAASGSRIAQFVHDKGVTNAAFSPDGHYVLTGTDTSGMMTGHLWEIASGMKIGQFEPSPKIGGTWMFGFIRDTQGRDYIVGWNNLTSAQIWQLYPDIRLPASCWELEVQVQTATDLKDDGTLQGISSTDWHALKTRYDDLVKRIKAGEQFPDNHCAH